MTALLHESEVHTGQGRGGGRANGPRIVTEARCSRCRKVKSASQFYACKHRPNGLMSSCKECCYRTIRIQSVKKSLLRAIRRVEIYAAELARLQDGGELKSFRVRKPIALPDVLDRRIPSAVARQFFIDRSKRGGD